VRASAIRVLARKVNDRERKTLRGSRTTQQVNGKTRQARNVLRGDEGQKNEDRNDQAASTARQAGKEVREAIDDMTDAIKRSPRAEAVPLAGVCPAAANPPSSLAT
jgi:hypothetical protein